MILFFYGEDSYRLSQKIRALKEKFISASLGDTNLAIVEAGAVKYAEIPRQILALPFLSKSRLVILKNFLKEKKEMQEKTLELLKKVPPSTVLVFTEEGKPDKRTSLYKQLIQKAQSQEFEVLDEMKLRTWTRKKVEDAGGEIDTPALSKLIEYIGNDLWRMENEIGKLAAYSKRLTAENIELLIQPVVSANIFGLIEAIAGKRPESALKELYKLLKSGQNELYILTMIAYQYKNMLIIKDIQERDARANKWAITKKAGLHPFVVEKTMLINQNYSLEKLKKSYRLISDFDTKIKAGKIEPKAALELLIYRLTIPQKT